MEAEVIEIRSNRIRSFINRHKVAITVAATSTVWFTINQISTRQYDEFLRENDLYDAYWNSEE